MSEQNKSSPNFIGVLMSPDGGRIINIDTSKRHVHYNEIIAFANGAEIQWFNIDISEWVDEKNPPWSEDDVYRIKPTDSNRVFPTTNLSIRKMYGLIDSGTYISIRDLQLVANEAIKQYILDTEAGK